jgi:hypothetical protein
MWTRTLTVAFLLLLATPPAAVRADVPALSFEPRPDPITSRVKAEAERLKRQAPLVITVEENAETARLLIPRKLVRAWQHASLVRPRDSAVASGRSWSRAMVVAGLGLAVALTLGGLWLTGRWPRGASRGAALLLLAVVALGLAGALVRANAPPPRDLYLYDRRPVPEPLRLKGKVEIEVVPQGDAIHLIVPRSMLAPLTQQRPPELLPSR